MRCSAPSHWTVMALIAGLVLPGSVMPAAAERLGRSFLQPRAVRAARKRTVIKARLSAAERKLHQHRVKLGAVKQQIRDTREQLHTRKVQVVRLSDQVRALQVRVDAGAKRLKSAEERLATARWHVEECTYRLRKGERRLAAHHQRLSRRVRQSYTAGTVTFLDVLLRAASLADFLDRHYYVERVFTGDVQFLTELRDEQHTVAQERAELEQQRRAQAAARAATAAQLHEVQNVEATRRQLLERVMEEKNLEEEQLEDLEHDSEAITALLDSEWRSRQALWRQLHHDEPMAPWVGSWLAPVAHCRISSRFGMRFHPILGYSRLHAGIDFAAPNGTPLRAAAAGEVLWAGWRGGYGRCIILLHGGGVATLYGHCSAVSVHPGQQVQRGQPIGCTGNTGLSTGPHLHFELRINGRPVDPLAH